MSSLTVVIPTHNRVDILKRTLDYLNTGSELPDFVIVVDDASDVPVESELASGQYQFPVQVIRHDMSLLQGVSRNDGIRATSTDLVLLLDDDIWPERDLIKWHKYFHRQHPEPTYAVLGRVVLDPELTRTPVLHYMEEYGPYFWLGRLQEGQLYDTGIVTPNVSIKMSFLKDDDLIDEGFPAYGNEDTEFGLRLMERGFEPRFHHGPSARHHRTLLALPDYFRMMENGGFSKAYWSTIRPDESKNCLMLEPCVKMMLRKEDLDAICSEYIDDFSDDFLERDVAHSSTAQFDQFHAFVKCAQGWYQNFGIIKGWKRYIDGFDSIFNQISAGLRTCNQQKYIRALRDANAQYPHCVPLALLLADKLIAVKQYTDVRSILKPHEGIAWAELRMGEAEFQIGHTAESLAHFRSVYDGACHSKAVQWEQRAAATPRILEIVQQNRSDCAWALEYWHELTERDVAHAEKWVYALCETLTARGLIPKEETVETLFPQIARLANATERIQKTLEETMRIGRHIPLNRLFNHK